MPKIIKPNRYTGKATLIINGMTEAELGKEKFDYAIADSFARGMMRCYELGLLSGAEYSCLSAWEYHSETHDGE